jgi:hypothetical protein
MAEAQRVLRMGRTKMYELVTEWRQTGGQSGLRVIELGNALRVPRVALEELIGGPVHVPAEPAVRAEAEPEPVAAPTLVVAASNDVPERAPQSRQRSSKRPGTVPVSQLDLFHAPEAS